VSTEELPLSHLINRLPKIIHTQKEYSGEMTRYLDMRKPDLNISTLGKNEKITPILGNDSQSSI